MPISSSFSSLDAVVMFGVKVGKDSILIFETTVAADWSIGDGSERASEIESRGCGARVQ